MRTINEIVEGLNDILRYLDNIGCLSTEDINQWGSIMIDYYTWKELNEII